MSVTARAIIKEAYRVHFPKKLSALKHWEDLMKDEVRSIMDEEGEEAFKDLKKTTRSADARGPLLRLVTKSSGETSVVLTAEAQLQLRRRVGLRRGYVDVDHYGREFFFRSYDVGKSGLLETGFSLFGLAGPFVDEWREKHKREVKEAEEELKNRPLFKELDEEWREKLDKTLAKIRLIEDSFLIMEAILGQVGKQGRNPVEIPAEAFRVLLWPKKAPKNEWPENWKQRVEGALSALNALTFTLRTYRMEKLKAYGSMVGQWAYKPLGQGDGERGDGVYIIDVSSGFLGCIEAYRSGTTRLRSGGEAVFFHFTKELSKEERRALGWGKGQTAADTFITFDAGRPFYDAAAGLTPTQVNLHRFIESNVTLRKNTARKGNKDAKVHWKDKEANSPRLYGAAFCPILPPERNFLGALGRFKRNPEAGFTLWGSESHAARHHGGLLFQMGHRLPSGSAPSKRAEVITKALEDIKVVAMDYLGGTVVGHDGVKWVPFVNFRELDEKTLTRRLRIFFFLPEDWEVRRRGRFEETTGSRVTESPEEAERETWEGEVRDLGTELVTEDNGFRGWPLHLRLRAMMKRRGLRQKDLAPLFGVSAPVITYWLKGTEPDEDGKVRGKRIPEDMVPLVVQWVETGESPSAEDLARLNVRREKRPGKKKA